VQVVDAQAIDVGAKVRKLVELFLLYSPIKAVVPLLNQFLEIGQAGSVLPVTVLYLVGPAGMSKTVP
jgi:hypothetical protein